MAQLNNSTAWTATGSVTSFTVTIPATAAGATLICVSLGGAIVTAKLGGTGGTSFTKRTPRSLSTEEIACQDITDSTGGTTTIGIVLNGADNSNGMIFEFAGSQLTFSTGAANGTASTVALDAQKQASSGSFTTSGRAVIFSAFGVVDATATAARKWWGLEPLGKVFANGRNGNAGSVKYWYQIGLSDQAAAGTFNCKTARMPLGNYQAAAWAYADSSSTASYTNPYANAIMAENSLPGSDSTSWFGGTTNTNIAGFTDKTSYLPGDTVNFKVDSNNIAFNVEITRIGCYGYVNTGGKLYTTVAGSPAVQSAPSVDALGGTVCSWSTTATWAIPSTMTPGIFVANFRRTDNTTFVASHVFVVRSTPPGSRGSKIMIKASDYTWQAYNVWGARTEAGALANFTGRSLYYKAPSTNNATRAFNVSFDRPYSTSSERTQTYFFDSEISLIGFLEGNGYDIDYYSMVDIEKSTTIPSKYAVAVSSGHDEYWTANLMDAFANARDAGTNLAFFTSNEALWHVRFDSGDTDKRKIICYKDSLDLTGFDNATKYDPTSFTGTWRDSRTNVSGVNNTSRRPESALSGQWFIANAPQSVAMLVPDTYKTIPMWRSTAVTSLGSGASQTLGASGVSTNIIGDEFDYVKTNESTTPTNIVRLQSQNVTLTGTAADDNGAVYTGNGTFQYGMSMYLANSGALVFATGTWRWGIGINRFRLATADINGNVDPVMQQATLNLFKDLGVSPGAIMDTVQNNNATALVDPGAAQPASAYGLINNYIGWGQPI